MKKILTLLLVFVAAASCTDDFENLNNNPNLPSTSSDNLAPVFTYVQRHAFAETRFNTWRGNLIFGSRFADQWSFSFSGTWFGNAAGFGYNSGWTDAAWDDPYSKVSGNLVAILGATDAGAAAEDLAINAITRIMKGFFYQRMTDQFGAIPYSEAGTGVAAPAFESQQAVYNDIMEQLGQAIADLKTVGSTHAYASADIVYGGDVSQWIKAANTLRLRMALRAQGASGSNSASVITAAMAEGQFLSSNADNFSVARDPSNLGNLFNGYSDIWWTWDPSPAAQWVLSNTMVDALKASNDPRLFALAQPIDGGTAGVAADYEGSIVGANADYINANPFTSFSKPNAEVYSEGSDVRPSTVMNYAEAELLQAEALYQTNLASAQTHFENALRGHMEQWGVPAADIATYLASPAATLVAGTAYDQIALQRWIAAHTYGYEAWAIARRMNVAEQLGFDEKTVAASGTPGYASSVGGAENLLPRRLRYSSNVVLLNAAGHAQGVEMNGGPDLMTTRLWWDQN